MMKQIFFIQYVCTMCYDAGIIATSRIMSMNLAVPAK